MQRVRDEGLTLVYDSQLKRHNVTEKPVLQTTPSHSKLVTAKLTVEGQRSTITGPGWSRPSSTSSSVGPPLPGAGASSIPGGTPAAPQPAPVGKIIQPQPRGAVDYGFGKKDGQMRPAWGTGKGLSGAQGKPDLTQTDFPTAAEVAQGLPFNTSYSNRVWV